MEEIIKNLYEQFSMTQNPLINTVISVFFIIIVFLIVWWCFNFVIKRLSERYEDSAFFKENKRFLALMKKAGHYIILTLAAISLFKIVNANLI